MHHFEAGAVPRQGTLGLSGLSVWENEWHFQKADVFCFLSQMSRNPLKYKVIRELEHE